MPPTSCAHFSRCRLILQTSRKLTDGARLSQNVPAYEPPLETLQSQVTDTSSAPLSRANAAPISINACSRPSGVWSDESLLILPHKCYELCIAVFRVYVKDFLLKPHFARGPHRDSFLGRSQELLELNSGAEFPRQMF